MACQHENLSVTTLEEVTQSYWNNPELDSPWGDTKSQEIVQLVNITCLDCGADVTHELRDKLNW